MKCTAGANVCLSPTTDCICQDFNTAEGISVGSSSHSVMRYTQCINWTHSESLLSPEIITNVRYENANRQTSVTVTQSEGSPALISRGHASLPPEKDKNYRIKMLNGGFSNQQSLSCFRSPVSYKNKIPFGDETEQSEIPCAVHMCIS